MYLKVKDIILEGLRLNQGGVKEFDPWRKEGDEKNQSKLRIMKNP